MLVIGINENVVIIISSINNIKNQNVIHGTYLM